VEAPLNGSQAVRLNRLHEVRSETAETFRDQLSIAETLVEAGTS
jgi:hypothetical protein